MLQIKEICKRYITGDVQQTALNKVSLNLRDNEFIAILGHSGSGKTTLLNIIGGLDRYDSGDLIINGISTKEYKDRDWDSYRNHTIGFVFQSYNLISHQSVLANVELALTISGISSGERRQRATKALEEVGLGDHLNKKPNQLSGGQMQRVAIARALVNNPYIILADEPTGALDTETSVQVMELLKEVAKNRLVVMVTHNPDLADKYANRIVRLSDGKIIDDSNPYTVDETNLETPQHKNMGRASMSFLAALSLSFNNLSTKKGRTFLTSFAGSIGIIGIALILAFSNGVNKYISDVQKDAMLAYSISIEAEASDVSDFMNVEPQSLRQESTDHELDGVYSNSREFARISNEKPGVTNNNLTEFKKYLDNPNSEIHQYIGENGIVYLYDTRFSVYTHDQNGTLVNTDGSTLVEKKSSGTSTAIGSMNDMFVPVSSFEELIPGKNNTLISPAVTENYDLLYGSWPSSYDEVILVTDSNNEISTSVLYRLGILPTSEYRELKEKIESGKEISLSTKRWDYKDICNQKFYMIPACDTYVQNADGTFTSVTNNTAEMEKLLKKAVQLKVTGVVRPINDKNNASISSNVAYTKALTDHIIEYTGKSAVVKAQQANKIVNVLNGLNFSPKNDAEKIKDAKTYISRLGITEKAQLYVEMVQSIISDNNPEMTEQILFMSENELASMMDSYIQAPDNNVLLSIYKSYITSPGSYDENMSAFGVVSADDRQLSVYIPIAFRQKTLLQTV